MKITKKQKAFLDKVVKGKWSINPDTGFVDVDGCIYMSNMGLNEIPLKFGELTGDFDCSDNKLISLEGAPKLVNGYFYCSYNQ
jgi:hypothetical protein